MKRNMREEKNGIIYNKSDYHDVWTVESQRNDLAPEEFPDGPYGSARNAEHLGKSSPYLETQHANPRFTYEGRQFHEGHQRQFPGSHPTHDE